MLLTAFLLAIAPVFALGQTLEPNDPSGLIAWLSPVIIWGTIEIAKLFKKIPGGVILYLVVPLLSLASAWVLEKLQLTDLNFWLQFLYGFLAVVIDQLKSRLQKATTELE